MQPLAKSLCPSCSAVEALERQEPFINQTLAASALAMLARLFRYGRLCHHGGFFDAGTGQMTSIPVDPDLWTRTRRRYRDSRRSGQMSAKGCSQLLSLEFFHQVSTRHHAL